MQDIVTALNNAAKTIANINLLPAIAGLFSALTQEQIEHLVSLEYKQANGSRPTFTTRLEYPQANASVISIIIGYEYAPIGDIYHYTITVLYEYWTVSKQLYYADYGNADYMVRNLHLIIDGIDKILSDNTKIEAYEHAIHEVIKEALYGNCLTEHALYRFSVASDGDIRLIAESLAANSAVLLTDKDSLTEYINDLL